MKKITAMFLVCMMSLAMLMTGLAEGHTHEAGTQWDRDENEHWHLCGCGEKMDVAAHVMDENYTTLCTVCGSDIWVVEGMFIDIQNYDEYGRLTRYTSLDGEGNLLDEYFYQYEYDADGNVLHSKTYWGEMLVEETDYALSFFGEYQPRVQKGYYEGILSSDSEYDEYGNPVKVLTYDEEGALMLEEITIYEYSEFGEITFSEKIGYYTDGSRYKEQTNEHGDQTSGIYYDENGEVSFEFFMEYEYDENGNMLWKKTYQDGVLTDENTFAFVENEWGGYVYEVSYTFYLEDGAKEVYEYNEYGDTVRLTCCDEEGAVETVHYYEYGYTENGEKLWEKCYVDEQLISEVAYAVFESEWGTNVYIHSVTEYWEDGSRNVTELDENGEIVSEKAYDAEGREIETLSDEE